MNLRVSLGTKLFLLAGLFSALTTYAGTPEQDPVVAKLRNEFSEGTTNVTGTDLKLGAVWNCTMFYATKDQFSHTPFIYQFQELDGVFQLSFNGASPSEVLAQTSNGLAGPYQYGGFNYEDVFRVTPAGDLIEELSLSTDVASTTGWVGDTSIADSGAMAMVYFICPSK